MFRFLHNSPILYSLTHSLSNIVSSLVCTRVSWKCLDFDIGLGLGVGVRVRVIGLGLGFRVYGSGFRV